MPPKLTNPIDETLRDFFETNIRPSEVLGYDPDQTWSEDTPPDDALIITTNWDDYGDFYPVIVVTDNDNGPVVPNSGETNYNSLSGNGSGPNQYQNQPITVSCQATEGNDYLTGAGPKEVARKLAQECHKQIQLNSEGVDSEYIWNGATPPIHTRSNTEENGTSTDTWHQYQITVDVGYIITP